jgi:glycosyltransferase involved in cell wall biosynthesis
MATTDGLTDLANAGTMIGPLKISVVIPCRNMGAYVGAAIDSVFAQTYAAHEVIVIDDKSEDSTLQVLESFGRRITALRGPGRGSSVARNLGILAATGDHIAFLDADDLWLPHKLERQAKLLSAECGFVFADWYQNDHPLLPAGSIRTMLRAYGLRFCRNTATRRPWISRTCGRAMARASTTRAGTQ